MFVTVDVYAIVNNHISDARAYSPQLLEQLKHSAMVQGYLLDQVECPDVVRTFLCNFMGQTNVLWSSGQNAIDKISCDGLSVDNRSFRLLVHNITKGTEYTLHEISGSKSRYNRSGPVNTQHSTFKRNSNALVGQMAAESAGKKEKLEMEKTNVTRRKSELANQLKAKKDALGKFDTELNDFKAKKATLKTARLVPEKLAQEIKREQDKEKVLMRQLSADIDHEKQVAFFVAVLTRLVSEVFL